MARLVVGLDSRHARREAAAGGKAATLARLVASRFPVPPGFAITARAFDHALRYAGLDDLHKLQGRSEAELAEARERMRALSLPPRLATQILDRYRRLSGPVAVRSSMIGEDSSTASFAGQLESVLGVSGPDAVLDAVRNCWASMLGPRLVTYREERDNTHGPGSGSAGMAVLVQEMVDAEAAGVAFSADPTTGQRCVIVEASPGLGDKVVSGHVDPDRYVVDGRGKLVQVCCLDPDDPVLDEGHVLELAGLVRRVARWAGTPQDVEWAWNEENVWLLQARPITSLAGKHVYSNRLSSEMTPGLMKPLLYTTNTLSMAENVFGRIFTDLIGPSDLEFTAMGRRVHSRHYTDLTVLGSMLERVGLPANFFEMMSRDEQGDRRRPNLSFGMVWAGFRLLRFAVGHGWMADEISAFNDRHSRELERFRRADWRTRDARGLLAAFDDLRRLHSETQWYVFLGPVNMLVRNRHLASIARKHAPDVMPGDLIKGLVGLKALEPNARLRAMATLVGQMGPDAVAVLMSADDSGARAQLSTTEEGRRVVDAFDEFLSEFGFLSTNGTDFTVAPWVETPDLLWRSIGRAALGDAPSPTESATDVRERARARVRSQLNLVQRIHFDRLLRTTTRYIDLRERTSMLMSEDAYQMRRVLLALGEDLVARDALDRPDDIFYLEYDELRALVTDELAPDRARETIARRRAEMAADACLELPDTFCGDTPPTVSLEVANDGEAMAGIAGSTGVARGFARVVQDPSGAPDSLTRDDILVVPFTDVGWTPLFAGIGGVVAETGGMLSHTAIVAREYGLPAVVSVKNAMRLIRQGQPLTVDGNAGRVYLHHHSDALGDEEG